MAGAIGAGRLNSHMPRGRSLDSFCTDRRAEGVVRVACLLHRGFALDLAPAPAPAVTVRIETPPIALGALQALAAMTPGQRGTLAGLFDGENLKGERASVVRRLVGVLVYQGYLRPADG